MAQQRMDEHHQAQHLEQVFHGCQAAPNHQPARMVILHFSENDGPDGSLSHFRSLLMKTGSSVYRFAVALALGAAVLLVWLSLGVGIIGADGDPANRMYFGVLAVGLVGALVARFQPAGMARALVATALAQALVAGIALVLGLGAPWSPPAELMILNGFFIVLFAGSAWLFRQAARAGPSTA
jgi:hypothetical protein